MKRIIVIVVAMLTVGAGVAYAAPQLGLQQRLNSLLSKVPFLNQKLAQQKTESLEGIVLGEEQSSDENDEVKSEEEPQTEKKSPFEIPPEVNGVLKSTTETVGNFINTSMQPFLQPDQKIEVDKAIQQAQQNLDELPSNIVEKARYDYCQQVVQDYESRQ